MGSSQLLRSSGPYISGTETAPRNTSAVVHHHKLDPDLDRGLASSPRSFLVMENITVIHHCDPNSHRYWLHRGNFRSMPSSLIFLGANSQSGMLALYRGLDVGLDDCW
jgi:hypothetical protein